MMWVTQMKLEISSILPISVAVNEERVIKEEESRFPTGKGRQVLRNPYKVISKCASRLITVRFIQQSPNPQLTAARDFEINHELSLWSFTFVTESFQCTYLTMITRR